MSKLKNKIQEGLYEMDDFDIEDTIHKAEDAVGTINIPPDQQDIIVAKAVSHELDYSGNDEMNEIKPERARLQPQDNPEGPTDAPYPLHITPKMLAKQQNAKLQQVPNPEYTGPEARPRLQQLGNDGNPLEEMGDDLESASRGVEYGVEPEVDGIDYTELDGLINQANGGHETPIGPDGENELPFEGVRPRMTKNELAESVLNHDKPKVIKRIKVKDIKNGK